MPASFARAAAVKAGALLTAVTLLLSGAPAAALAQTTTGGAKALVYCPVGVDVAGCDQIVAALTGSAAFPGGVTRAYDGTSSTVDLAYATLSQYAVLVIPSLADDSAHSPYAVLRSAAVQSHLKAGVTGRVAVWGGTPDLGESNRTAKNQLLKNLASWAATDWSVAGTTGLVVLADLSADAARRYDWLAGVSRLALAADAELYGFDAATAQTGTGKEILRNGSTTTPLAYANMASFGLLLPAGSSVGSIDAVGVADSSGTNVVRTLLVTTPGGGNTGAATIRTDKADYPPGDTVTFTGAGWTAGETVSINLHENPTEHPDRTITAVADSAGAIRNRDLVMEQHHLGVTFYVTAKGGTSGLIAQTSFTDGNDQKFGLTPSPSFTHAVGSCVAITITTLNNGGNPTDPANPRTFNLSGGTFYPSNACTGPTTTSVSISSPASSATVYYTNGTIGPATSITVTASGNPYSPASANTVTLPVTIVPKLAFTTPARTTAAGVCSAAITVQTQRATGAPVSPTVATDVGLTSSAGTGAFYTDAVCATPPVTSVSIPTSGNSATFYYKDATVGSPVVTATLTATTAPSDFVTQTEVVSAAGFALTVSTSGTGTGAVTSSPAGINCGTTCLASFPAGSSVTLTESPSTGSFFGGWSGACSGTATTCSVTMDAAKSVVATFGRTTTLTVDAASGTFGGTTNLRAVLAPAAIGKSISFTLNGTGVGSATTDASGVATIAAASLTGIDAGSYATGVGASFAGDAGYGASSGTAALTVGKANQTITFGPLAAKTYGDAPFAVTATAPGGAVTFASTTAGTCSVSGSTVTILAAGSCTIRASQTGGTNYDAAPNVDQSFTIAAKAVVITPTAGQSKVFGTSDPATFAFSNNASLTTSDFTGSLARVAGENVGTYAINSLGTLSAGGNYTLSLSATPVTFAITKATATIALSNLTQTYDGTVKAATATTTPAGLSGVTLSYAQGGTPVPSPTNAGSYAVTATLTNDNYQLAAPVTGTLVINQVTPTVEVTWVGGPYTGNPYDATAAVKDPSSNTLVSGAFATLAFYSGSTAAGAPLGGVPTNAGTYTVRASFAGNTNYAAAYTDKTITITQVTPTVEVTWAGGPYTGNPYDATAAVKDGSTLVSGVYATLAYYAGGSAAGTPLSGVPTNAGTYTVRASFAGNTNYAAAYTDKTITITQVTPTVEVTWAGGPYTGSPYDATAAVTDGSTLVSGVYATLAFYAGTTAAGVPLSGVPTNAGTYTVRASFVGNTNYAAAYTDKTITITRATPTFSNLSAPAITYSAAAATVSGSLKAGSTPATGSVTVTLAGPGGALIVNSALDASGNFTAGFSAAGLPANTTGYAISLSYPQSQNFDAASDNSLKLVVNKASQTITFGALAAKSYGDADFTVSASASSGLAVGFAPSGQCTMTGNSVHLTGAGSCTITATQAGDGNYDAAASVAQSFNIGKATPAVTAVGGSFTFDNSAKTGSGSATGVGGASLTPVSISYYAGSPAAWSPLAGAPVNAGTYTVRASFAATTDYNAASNDATLTIGKASSSVALTCPASVTYSGVAQTPCTAAATGVGGLNQSLTPTYSDNTNAGTATASATFAGDLNHDGSSNSATFEIARATPTVNVSWTGGTFGASNAATGSVVGVGGASLGTPTFSYVGTGGTTYGPSSVAPTNAGSYQVTASFAGNTNYEPNSATATTTIAKAASATTVTCPTTGQTYTGAAQTPCTARATGAGGLDVEVTPVTHANNVNVGTATASASYAGDANHDGSTGSGSFSIVKAGSVTTVSVSSAEYSGLPHGGSAVATGVGGLNQTLAVTYVGRNGTTYPASATAPTNAGDYTASATFAGDANHDGSTDSEDYSITKATLAIAGPTLSREYGEPNPSLAGTFSGAKNSETFTVTGTTTAVAASPIGAYPIVPAVTGATLGNYDVAPTNGTLTVTAAPLTVTTDAKTRVYGDANPTLTGSISGIKNGDNITATYATTAAAGSAVGSYAITATLVDPTAKLGNYNVTNAGNTLSVTPAPLTITANSFSRLYGQLNPPLTGTIAGIKNGDGITATYSTTATASSLPGSYPIVPAAVDATPAKLGNYTVSLVNGTLTVGNNAPVITGATGPATPIALGNPVSVSGTFTDVGLASDRTLYVVSSTWTSATSAPLTVTGTAPTYDGSAGTLAITAPSSIPVGVYTVKITVTDRFGAVSNEWTIANYVVVYDPNGSFVTGGGFINSPAGASTQFPQAVGKANFGFVSKYEKGATTPTGNTEFQFQAGNLNFKSTVYQWLVVSGARAQYKGEGRINGAGSYNFILTATDAQAPGGGSTDQFRIKITDKATGALVYDNMLDAPDDALLDAGTSISGGSIVIHK